MTEATTFTTLADAALAAYQLQTWEPAGANFNDPAGGAADAAAARLAGWQRLQSADLGLANAPAAANGAFQTGFRDGYYTNGNAAALVAIQDGALVISFRGTNDNDGTGSLDKAAILAGGGTPDEDNWFNFLGLEQGMADYYALLAPLVAAIDTFIADPVNGITKVYVTGHSLGGAMVNAFMDEHANSVAVKYEAVTFANPGYFTFDADTRITNFLNDTDLINAGDFVSSTPGDDNTLYDGLFAPADTHAMALYDDVLHFLHDEGVPDQNSYNSFIYQITVGAGGTFLIGTGNDTLSGTFYADVLLGGAGRDTIDGSSGADWLIGGTGLDTLRGGIGADTLTGGNSRDRMTGGYGADDFDFNAVADTGAAAATRDVITDFQHAYDDIDLSAIDANGAQSGNSAFKFLAAKGSAFTGVKGQLHWYQVDRDGTIQDRTIIEGDINGDKHADFQIELSGLVTITGGDFVL